MTPYVTKLLAAGEHPYLARIIMDAEDHPDPDPDTVFARRLGMVLDGLAASVKSEAELPTL